MDIPLIYNVNYAGTDYKTDWQVIQPHKTSQKMNI